MSKIKDNGTVGINFIGPEAEPRLSESIIENNKDFGILICVANKAKVFYIFHFIVINNKFTINMYYNYLLIKIYCNY